MVWLLIGLAVVVMVVLAAVMTHVLGWANRVWHIHENPLVAKVEAALAGLDCGQCGHPTCNEYARGVVHKGEAIDKCRPGGAASARAVADLMGVEAPEVGDHFAVVHCGARRGDRLGVVDYRGEATCAAADVVGTTQACVYGCLGLGDCERACPFDAIHVVDGLAVVDFAKCTACGQCVWACPRNIITVEPFRAPRVVVVACSNKDPGKATRAVCTVGCIACGLCQRACDLFEVRVNLSRLDHARYSPADHADAMADASAKCPAGCLPYRGPGAEAPATQTP